MTRRVTAGSAGGAGVAGLQAFTTTLTSANNLDITVDPTGTGRFLVAGTAQIQNQNTLRFADSDSSNWVAFRSAATVTSNVTWTLPAIDGSSRQTLTTNGSGILSWNTPTIAIENEANDSNLNYPLFTTETTGTITTGRVNATKLDYQPSTGRFRLLGNTESTSTTTGTLVVTGGVGISGQMTANSIVETSSITLKENVTPIKDALDSVIKLLGVTYDRIDTQEHEAGLIAEWVEDVLPDLVTRDKENNVVGIKYTKLTAYIVESIKELKQEIDQLKGR